MATSSDENGSKNNNPLYNLAKPKWVRGSDCYEGSDRIKERGTRYLPPTSGQVLEAKQMGQPSVLTSPSYVAYLLRAVYPDLYKDAVDATVGIMHRKPATIELPKGMEDMIENATLLGEPLEMVLRKINTRQLMTGRVGLLGDFITDAETKADRPILTTYIETAIPNWKDTSSDREQSELSIAVLNESRFEMSDSFEWEYETIHRVLALVAGDGPYQKGDVYGFAEVKGDENILASEFTVANVKGQTSSKIPFVFINSKDLSPDPDLPPFDGLAIATLAIYTSEADYRQSLFMQGQDTLVRIGAVQDDDEIIRTGAGARIDVPMGGDVKYVGVESSGLPEQRIALENDYKRAETKAGRLINTGEGNAESGEALKIRVAAQTANIPTIAKTAASGMEQVLKTMAVWLGFNPDEVKVVPNLEFSEADLNGKTLVEILQAKALGAPISKDSIHAYMQEQGVTKLSLEEELTRIEAEPPEIVIPPAQTGVTNDE